MGTGILPMMNNTRMIKRKKKDIDSKVIFNKLANLKAIQIYYLLQFSLIFLLKLIFWN